jgi:FMN reductase
MLPSTDSARPSDRPLRVVGVSGSLVTPSKTTVLVRSILDEIAKRRDAEPHLIQLHELGRHLGGAVARTELPEQAELELQRIESADLLVVASPVYRATFTGLFKHLFDFVDQYALVDTPVLLAATGGSDRHALMIEHQLRPLFGFFQAVTLPIGVYASDSDFADYRVTSDRLRQRIDLAVTRAEPFLGRELEVTRPAWW